MTLNLACRVASELQQAAQDQEYKMGQSMCLGFVRSLKNLICSLCALCFPLTLREHVRNEEE